MKAEMKEKIQELADRGAIFYISDSGGKDSQCMRIELEKMLPQDQTVIIHADLAGVEWADTQKQIRRYTEKHQVIICKAGKTWWDMVDSRQKFPGPKYRQCTSDLKRDPIHKAIRKDLKAKGKTLAVNCVGLRAEESSGRARLNPIKINSRLSKAGREVWELLPIHDYLVADVFRTIEAAGQEPHWVYGLGNERMSCVFCIMGSTNDWQVGARNNPDLYRRFVEKEKELGFTMKQGATMEEVTGIYLDGREEQPTVYFEDTEFTCGGSMDEDLDDYTQLELFSEAA